MLKADVLKQLEKIPDDEPIFLLRARDRIASTIVRTWAAKAMIDYGCNAAKVDGAQQVAKAMERWQEVNHHLVKAPD